MVLEKKSLSLSDLEKNVLGLLTRPEDPVTMTPFLFGQSRMCESVRACEKVRHTTFGPTLPIKKTRESE